MTDRRLEIGSTVLLAVATLLTAWSAYQARQWTGEQALNTSKATATRLPENRTAALKVQSRDLRVVLLGIGALLFLVALVWLATLPMRLMV